MIQIENLTFYYTNDLHTFRFPDFNLKTQEDLLIMGKSGIGKTTLLHLLAGLLQPISGNITIDGTNINTLSHRALDIFRGKHIGIVFQKNHAIQSLSVIENLKARLYFSKKVIRTHAIEALLEDLNILEVKDRKVHALSEGQLQRLGIAMSVIHQPKLILADEPTSSLDDDNCEIVIKLLKRQAQKNKAHLIVITHDHRIQSFFKNSITL